MQIPGRYIDYVTILAILVIGSLYLGISLRNPIVFGDEGYYAATARWMAQNLKIPEFTPLFENKIVHDRFSVSKPLFFVYETFGYFIAGETGAKILIALPAIVASFFLYFFISKLYGKITAALASIFFLLVPSLVTYGVLGYTDALLMMLIIPATHFGILAFEQDSKKYALLGGIFTGLALITKNSAAYLLLFFLLYFVLMKGGKNFKILFLLLIFSTAFFVPWLARNMAVYGHPCYWKFYDIEKCTTKRDIQVPKISGLEFEGRTNEVATEQGLFRFGILNYSRFAYGWAIPVLFFFGLAWSLTRLQRADKIILLWLLTTIPLIIFSTWRAEDTARYMLPLNVPLVVFAAVFSSMSFQALKAKNILVGFLILLIAIGWSWVYGYEKIVTMDQVKRFIPGVIDACDWVKDNTPKDSNIYATYGSQIRYQCERNLAIDNDAEEVFLGNESASYEHLKLNGINYIFVINALITPQKFRENYPQEFVSMLESSNNFKKVYDNGDRFGVAGARIYEVL